MACVPRTVVINGDPMTEQTKKAPWTKPSLQVLQMAASTRTGPPNPNDNMNPGMSGS